MPFGVSDQGFSRKRLEDILVDKNAAVQAVFGTGINLEPESQDGQINQASAESDAALWELAEAAYNAFNPNAASGVVLDNLVELNGLTRQPATPSTVSLDFTGVNGTLVPAGSVVESDGGFQFATDADVTIAGGVATVAATCTEVGSLVAPAGTITTIVTPITGWTSVTNPADAVIGESIETDEALRVRRLGSVSFPSQSILDGISAAIGNISDVRSVTGLENELAVVDGNGQAAHSIQMVVTGGADQEIADAIYARKTLGAATDGNTTVQVADIQGTLRDIKFTRPSELQIYVVVNLTITAAFPSDGDQQIKDAIIAYANTNFGAGQDVIYSRLFTPVNTVPGHQIDDLYIGTAPAPTGTANIPVAFNQISKFSDAEIVINV